MGTVHIRSKRFIVATLAVLATSVIASVGWGQGGAPADAGSLAMSKFYVGSASVQTGVFPGTLTCLRCDLGHAPGAGAQCREAGHVHALTMDDGSMVHPLLAGNEETLKRVNSAELHGKKVKVQGKYYPSTGAIFVGSIELAE